MSNLQKKSNNSSNIDDLSNTAVNVLDNNNTTTTTTTNSNTTKNADDECNELKNITYKNRMIKKNKYDASFDISNKSQDSHANLLNINMFLEKEKKINKGEPWNKLDKTEKIQQFNNYIDTIVQSTHSLTENEMSDLKSYLYTCLDRKKLLCVKDVQYDKIVGKIKLIPCLHFNQVTRKFTLKRSDKRVSTSKSLGQGQKPSTTPAPAASTKKEKVKEKSKEIN
jgi:hypothetical protein